MRRRQAAFSLKYGGFKFREFVFSCGYVLITLNCATYQTFTIPVNDGRSLVIWHRSVNQKRRRYRSCRRPIQARWYSVQQTLSTLYWNYIQIFLQRNIFNNFSHIRCMCVSKYSIFALNENVSIVYFDDENFHTFEQLTGASI